jgi:hypothetical protein
MEIVDYVLFLLTATLWGTTNVVLKNTSKGIKDIKIQDSKVKQIAEELKYLITNWRVRISQNITSLKSDYSLHSAVFCDIWREPAWIFVLLLCSAT